MTSIGEVTKGGEYQLIKCGKCDKILHYGKPNLISLWHVDDGLFCMNPECRGALIPSKNINPYVRFLMGPHLVAIKYQDVWHQDLSYFLMTNPADAKEEEGIQRPETDRDRYTHSVYSK